MIRFFMSMVPPSTTHQQKKVMISNGKPVFYEPADLKAARSKLMGHLGQHVPDKKIEGSLQLITKWLFPIKGKHFDGEYKTTKPDVDNLQKLLMDCMSDLGFWKDDRFVSSLVVEKFYAETPGIYIEINILGE